MIPVYITAPVVFAATVALGIALGLVARTARIEAGSAALPTDDEEEK